MAAAAASSTDPHAGRFNTVAGGCVTCHPTGTKRVELDHVKVTGWGHAGQDRYRCRDCHRGMDPTQFEQLKTGTDCMGCHEHENVHEQKYASTQCASCHGVTMTHPPRHPPPETIAHGRSGTFPLVKGHTKVPCADCHPNRNTKGRRVFELVNAQCNSCHQDGHGDALGKVCDRCHVGGIWTPLAFDHQKSWEIRGAHLGVTCDGCHSSRAYTAPSGGCYGCHSDADVHKGSLGTACERCHREDGVLIFDHASARYPLTGAHTTVACADCHPSQTFAPRPQTCYGCHPVSAEHLQERGTACEQCHVTASWQETHARQVR